MFSVMSVCESDQGAGPSEQVLNYNIYIPGPNPTSDLFKIVYPWTCSHLLTLESVRLALDWRAFLLIICAYSRTDYVVVTDLISRSKAHRQRVQF